MCLTSTSFCFLNPRKDCGVFVMKFLEDWTPETDMCSIFSHLDVLNLRILYANRLYFFSQNEVDMSLVTDFYAAV